MLNRHGTRLDIGTPEDVAELDAVEAMHRGSGVGQVDDAMYDFQHRHSQQQQQQHYTFWPQQQQQHSQSHEMPVGLRGAIRRSMTTGSNASSNSDTPQPH
ncbi:uncharacterized protein TM35_000181970 [Trypanosoma theileri]|uniref:Uncharacterized protein n=1 Tax=Trypanosoma theileri TaxID=67003 RepID=A0A1X0NVJ1_9TRYP|nr:uncharacterized protein TM35_000181970 [Trypanosoma theileri]ORC88140.1 hypothetical protein TM35_000181970 [Trypanosoma theileri]